MRGLYLSVERELLAYVVLSAERNSEIIEGVRCAVWRRSKAESCEHGLLASNRWSPIKRGTAKLSRPLCYLWREINIELRV